MNLNDMFRLLFLVSFQSMLTLLNVSLVSRNNSLKHSQFHASAEVSSVEKELPTKKVSYASTLLLCKGLPCLYFIVDLALPPPMDKKHKRKERLKKHFSSRRSPKSPSLLHSNNIGSLLGGDSTFMSRKG